jgi:hypothetical protein
MNKDVCGQKLSHFDHQSKRLRDRYFHYFKMVGIGTRSTKSGHDRSRLVPFFNGVVTVDSRRQFYSLHQLIRPMDFHLID